MTKEDYMPPRPQFTPQISFGNVIQIIVLVGGFLVGYVKVQEQAAQNDEAWRQAQGDRAGLEIRIRSLETSQARADERYNAILEYLSRIDTRLERIEASGPRQ